jgi:hypothetical protein
MGIIYLWAGIGLLGLSNAILTLKVDTKAMEMKRLTALSVDIIDPFFEEVQKLQTQYNVLPHNILNMDEKGFQMGQITSGYCLFDAESGPPLAPSTGNTKWVSIIECIDADGGFLSPFIIFMGQEPETQWWPATNTLPRWIWAFSSKGWTDNELSEDWLNRVMIPYAQQSEQHHILILDGHQSHCTASVQLKCYQN